MPWMRDAVEVEYHQQNTPTFCGPASAMMILASLDRQVIQQDELFKVLHPSDGSWSTSPEGLAAGLNTWSSPPFRTRFAVVDAATETDGTASIVDALSDPDGPAPAALVYGNRHWVVVTDVNVDDGYVQGQNLPVKGFYLNNPSVTRYAPPRMHYDEDECGSDASFGSLSSNQYVTREAWRTEFFTGYSDNPTGRNHFVVVRCNTRSAPGPAASIGAGSGPPPARPVDGLIDRAVAQKLVIAAIKDHRLDQDGPLKDAIIGCVPGVPQLVQHLEMQNWYYYLIPLQHGTIDVAIARIDAVYGTFLGVSALEDEENYQLPTRDDVLADVSGRFTVAANCVWRPCRESTSPFDAFYQLSVPGVDLSVYQSHSGIHLGLTPLGPGG